MANLISLKSGHAFQSGTQMYEVPRSGIASYGAVRREQGTDYDYQDFSPLGGIWGLRHTYALPTLICWSTSNQLCLTFFICSTLYPLHFGVWRSDPTSGIRGRRTITETPSNLTGSEQHIVSHKSALFWFDSEMPERVLQSFSCEGSLVVGL